MSDADGWFAAATAAGVGLMGFGAAALYSYMSRPLHLTPFIDFEEQSVQCSDKDLDRACTLVGNKPSMERLYEDVRTCYDGMRRGQRVSDDGPCLGRRIKQADGSLPYVWLTYSETLSQASNLAEGILAKGIASGQNTLIGIYSINRPEWVITEQACFCYNMITVPLYDTLGPDASKFIITQGEIKLVVCDNVQKLETLLGYRKDVPSLTVIVVMDEVPSETKTKAKSLGVEVYQFQELVSLGEQATSRHSHTPPSSNDIATVCYTSGTTGTPKGVMLSHGNIIAATTVLATFKYTYPTKDEVLISYLPLAHMFERMMQASLYQTGARIGFYRGDVKLLTEDILELKPTFLPVVPRLLNRIYAKVIAEVSKSSLKKYLFDWALHSKMAELNNRIIRHDGFWDRLVFAKVRTGLGGRVRLICTGSAPCAENVLDFIRAASGAVVLEGYGQTECAAIATVSIEGDASSGHVGPPIPCCRIKMADVPDMNYFAANGCGEVCIKGPNVFKGYFKDPKRTAETLDSNGWLHTGDIGRWLPDGKVKLIDRKKQMFKLSHGEYIAPEKIEGVYTNSKFVAQVFVYGESLKSALVAIVVPDVDVLSRYAREEGMATHLTHLCRNDGIKKTILDDMTVVGKKAGLFSFEQVKAIYVVDDPFTVNNGLLTPTFKSKRPSLQEKFAGEIAAMYAKLD